MSLCSGRNANYTCPACGFLVFTEPPGSYALCPICGWEDDCAQLSYPGMRNGANWGSLKEYQESILKELPATVSQEGDYKRDEAWRPLRAEECRVPARDQGIAQVYFQTASEDAAPYYWRLRRQSTVYSR